jgi:UDP-3-O-[3-hydroxymyristoyl] glucosamine N-acyltransferase
VDDSARIGARVHIAAGVTVGPDVCIGDDCVICSGASLYHQTKIGKRVWIDSGAVLGAEGFGFERDDEGVLIKFPQIGSVVVDDDVEIGANACIDRGALDETRIRRGVKIDNLVHVSHNCDIGEDTLVVAHACLCGSVKIGRRCWIGPNSSVLQKVVIGDDVKVGVGAVVLNNIPSGVTIMGCPAIDVGRFGNYMQAVRTRNFLQLPKTE